MLIVKRVVVWLIERVIEVGMAAYLMFVVFGSNNDDRFPGFWGDIKFYAAFILLYYSVSLYFVSCFYFGLLRRQEEDLNHIFVMTSAFAVHALYFFIFFGTDWKGKDVELTMFGMCIVAFAHVVGAVARRVLSARLGSE